MIKPRSESPAALRNPGPEPKLLNSLVLRERPDQSAWLRNDDNSVYTMADAILHASFLNSCLRHCGSLAMTNLSPLVNTRGPIFTHPEGIVLRPVYHVCDLYRSQLAGEVLDAYVRMPSFEAASLGQHPAPRDGRRREITPPSRCQLTAVDPAGTTRTGDADVLAG